MNGQVLLVEDDVDLRAATAQTLEIAGFNVESFDSARPALKHLSPAFNGVLVTDVRMPGMDGLALFERVLEVDRGIPVLLVTGHGDIAMAVRALHAGAFDFLAKPFSTEHLTASVARALQQRALVLDNRRLRAELGRAMHDIVGGSTAIQTLRTTLAQVARTDLDVLITGETGTGKELFARTIHSQSTRADGPFVPFHAAAADGSATAIALALADAEGGVLFIDELRALPLVDQAVLIDAVERRQIQRADEALQACNVRLIAASTAVLEPMVADGGLRSDLFYRVSAVRIAIPPLRERKDDIAPLFTYFVRQALGEAGGRRLTLSAADRRALTDNDWPGNARELRNFAYAVALGLARPVSASKRDPAPLALRIAEFEKNLLHEALETANGQVTSVANALGTPRKTLYEKLAKYGLDPAEYRKR